MGEFIKEGLHYKDNNIRLLPCKAIVGESNAIQIDHLLFR
jgi:hypothetical protein